MKIKKSILHEFYNEELEMLDSDVVIHEHILDKTKPNERKIMRAKMLYVFYKVASIAFLLAAFTLLVAYIAAICSETNNIFPKFVGAPSLLCCFCIILNNVSGDMFDKYAALVNNFFADEVKAVEKKNKEIEDKYNGAEEKETFKKELGEWVSTLLCYPPDIMYEMIVKFVKEHEDKRQEAKISERPLVDVIAELMTFPTDIVYPLLIKVIEKYQEKYGEEVVKQLGGYIARDKND